jgi:hypothetical protein
MNELPQALQLDDEGYICDERGILMRYDRAIAEAIVARYNAHTAREQVLADVAEMATELARVLANYNEAYALVRQMRATLKRAREDA